jgi:hypothetical protein
VPSREPVFAPVPVAVLLLTTGTDGEIGIFAHGALPEVVEPDDLSFIESLIRDFHERAKDDPEDLFRQLSSLATGPLVTMESGNNPAQNISVRNFVKVFTKL